MELLEVAPDDFLGIQCLSLKRRCCRYSLELLMEAGSLEAHLDVLQDAGSGSLHPSDAVQLLLEALVAEKELLLGKDAAEDISSQ